MWHQAFGIEWDKGDKVHHRLDNAWRLDRAYDWPDRAVEANPSPVNDAKVTLAGISDGTWSVGWWGTLTGKCLATGETTASGGTPPLAPPAFQVDIAARLKRR